MTALAAFAFRLARRQPIRGAVGGLALAGVCALVAELTGQARGFFLLPTVLPAVILLVCLGSITVRRPLTGVLLNRIAGGPADWRHRPALIRIHIVSTLAAVAVNAVNFTLQATFYLADQPLVLAVAHVATGPVFACLVAATVIAVRRHLHLADQPTDQPEDRPDQRSEAACES